MFVALATPFGNKSNRLLQDAHFRAYCAARNYDFYNPHLKLIDFHECFDVQLDAKLPIDPPASWRPVLLGGIMNSFNSNRCCDQLDRHVRRWGHAFVGGWGFRAGATVAIYSDMIKSRYVLDKQRVPSSTREQMERIMSADVSCAVHVRRNDYRTWSGGKFFFSNEDWNKILKSFERDMLEKSGRKVKFFLFSDEPDTVDTIENAYLCRNHWSLDQYLMGICDYIVAPPSTFSMWASFMWGGRLLTIGDPATAPVLESAVRCRTLE